MTNTETSALASVAAFHFLTPAEWDACFDVLIPGGFIDVTGTWFLTAKGIAALSRRA